MHVSTASCVASPINGVRVAAFQIPTEEPESDGTLEWSATTLVVVELRAGGETGFGFTYADAGVARCIRDHLGDLIDGRAACDIDANWTAMFARLRNLGREGMAAMAVSAVDVALWDLKARLLGVPLVTLIGRARRAVPAYGSGGFTSYSDSRLREQFAAWAERGVCAFKMKVGRDPDADPRRVAAARREIGDRAALMVDANSAYSRNEALLRAERFHDDAAVCWLEQPLAPEDLDGLRFLRQRAPAGLEIAEGEYGAGLDYFRRLLAADAAHVVMPDATRCGGITGFLKIAALCEAYHVPLSTHCAPALHAHLGCAIAAVRHVEYFHDHARIEQRFFDGAPALARGNIEPSADRPGLGFTLKWSDAGPYAA